MMQRTDLSIVLPIHNSSASRALAQLPSQLKDLSRDSGLTIDLIVVDDASSDGTVAVAREALRGLENAKLVTLESNGGPGRARNAGLDFAEGEFVAFVDDDDVADVGVLLEGVSLARRTSADVVTLGYEETGDGRAPLLVPPMSGGSLGPSLTRRAAVWRFIFRSDFLTINRVRFPELFYAEDVIFTLRVAEAMPRVESLAKRAYSYHIRSSGLSGSTPPPQRAEMALQELMLLEESSASPEVVSLAHVWAARIAFRCRRGLLRTHPRLLAHVTALMVANPKDAWLLARSSRRSRRPRAMP